MLIYGQNLHEKLLGIALSKDYIKYATAYCDLVDDPELALDIDIAVNFNNAMNGDVNAARALTDAFMLSGGFLDPSTRNFYRDKMANNPQIFSAEIDRMNNAFNGGFGGGGIGNTEDCFNSPCNLFAQTSDSIGRMAQSASTKNGSNSFGVDGLKDTFINLIDGLDQTIFNKMPYIFQNAVVDITQTANKAKENAQAIFAGKKNLNELVNLAQKTGTLRGGDKVYRYTPDIKSYRDYNDMGSAILSKIKDSLGGCFSTYEQAYRYNPYEHNQSTPIGVQVEQYNGQSYDRAPNGVYSGSPVRTGQLSNNYKPTKPEIDDGSVVISESIILGPKANGNDGYSSFGAGISTEEKLFLLDDYGVTADDQYTLDGISAFGASLPICPSRFLSNPTYDRLNQALAGYPLNDGIGIVNKYSQGWITSANFDDLEILHYDDKIFNDGIAPSAKLWRLLLGDKQTKNNFRFTNSFYRATRANQTFVAIRRPGEGEWKLIKVVDINSQKILNVDFTPGAYAAVFGEGKMSSLRTRPVKSYKTTAPGTMGQVLAEYGWKVLFHGHSNDGDIEVRACIGNAEDIKRELNASSNPVDSSLDLGPAPFINGVPNPEFTG